MTALVVRLHARIRARHAGMAGGNDDGAALVMVMLITILITALLGAVIAATTANLRGSGLDRKRGQTAAAAEAGIDATLASLQISAGTSLPCSTSGSVSGASYVANVVYYAANGSTIACTNGTVASTPATAEITSTGSGSAPYSGASAANGNRVMTALVRMTAGTASGPTLDKAVFSDSSITLTNAWKLVSVSGSDASLYTNGNFTCNSTPTIAGSVYAQGTASLTNTCWVDGDVWANGNITTSTTGIHVGGSIKSTTGGLSEGNHGIYIGKDVQVKTTCCGGSPTGKAGDGQVQTVGGTIQTGVTLTAPPAETFPQIAYSPSSFPGYSVVPWATWEKTNAVANGAPSWSSAQTGDCSVASASYSLNGPLLSPSTPTIIDARSCSPMSWNTVTLKLASDLTIFASSFYSTNGVTVTSADGANHVLRIIVPWSSTATTCAGTGAGNITFDAGGTSLPSNIQMMLYTPGQLTMTNNIDFYGQVYGCTISASVNVTVRYVPVGAGGGSSGTPAPYKVDVAYLRDS